MVEIIDMSKALDEKKKLESPKDYKSKPQLEQEGMRLAFELNNYGQVIGIIRKNAKAMGRSFQDIVVPVLEPHKRFVDELLRLTEPFDEWVETDDAS